MMDKPKCFVPEYKNADECLGWSKDTYDDEPLEMCKKCMFCSAKYEESEGEE